MVVMLATAVVAIVCGLFDRNAPSSRAKRDTFRNLFLKLILRAVLLLAGPGEASSLSASAAEFPYNKQPTVAKRCKQQTGVRLALSMHGAEPGCPFRAQPAIHE